MPDIIWKGTTQGSFQQSLVEIGSVVTEPEEKIFLKFHPPFFLFFAWWPSWLEVGITRNIFGRGPSKDYSTKVWLQLAQWFLRRRLKCEMLTDGRRTADDRRWTKSDGLELKRYRPLCTFQFRRFHDNFQVKLFPHKNKFNFFF